MRKLSGGGWLLFCLLIVPLFPSIAPADEAPPYLWAVAMADGVNVRSQPSEGSEIIGKVWHGVGMRVYQIRAGWFMVELSNGEKGWVRSEFVETTAPEGEIPVPEEATAEVLAAEVNLEPYRVQVGDELLIKSFKSPEINEQTVVRPDGYISVLLLHDIFVVGRTPTELDHLLTTQYRKYFSNPDVTVIVNQIKEVIERKVFVGGEVEHPMELRIQTPLTVLQAIISAGGFKETAKSENVILVRKGKDNKPLLYSLNLSNIKGGEAIRENVYLQPFDIVYVPSTSVAEVGKFVDQHINKILPRFISVGFSWFRQFP